MWKQVLDIGHELRREIEDKRPAWLNAVRLGILKLLLTVSRDWEPQDANLRQERIGIGQLAQIVPAIDLVHSDPTRRLTLREAAATCGLSASQFSFVFRHTMDLTFGAFRTRVRLSQAARLLLGTTHSVETIAERAGFTDGSHLHRAFVRYYGRTPAQYRQLGQSVPARTG